MESQRIGCSPDDGGAGNCQAVCYGKDPVCLVMEIMTKAAALAVTALLCAGVVRRGAQEFSVLLVLAAGTGIFVLAAEAMGQVLEHMEHMSKLAQIEETVLRPVVKTTAISILTKITGELCRGGGEGGLAAFVETAGTMLALWVALPLAEGVLELMGQLLV